MLYELSKKSAKHGDKPTDEYLFEKESKEFTFRPNLSKEQVEGFSNQYVIDAVKETLEKKKEECKKKEKEKGRFVSIRGEDDPKLRFGLNQTKFTGTFDQFSKKSKKDLKKSKDTIGSSVMKEEKKVESAKPTSPLEISPQQQTNLSEEDDRAINMPMQIKKEPDQKALSKEAKEKEPLLYIDVNLANMQKKIIVFKGDTAQKLAAQFAEENSLAFYLTSFRLG